MKSFYYQRCGVAKQAQITDPGYGDPACHTGNLQDTDCRLYNNTGVISSRDLSGGWHDAGDYNKYVNFAWNTLIDLLLAFEESPAAWTDDTGIPESGNQVPDILDEIKFELDWLLKMQNQDGSVLSLVGGGSGSPPSSDHAQRLYGPATTAASYSAAAMFALAAIEFQQTGMTAYAQTLETAAVNAFNWAENNPNITFYNAGVLAAGEQQTDAYGTEMRRLSTATFLFALTQQNPYRIIIENHYAQVHLIQWSYAYLFETAEQDFLLYFAKQPGVTPSVKNDIIAHYTNSLRQNNGDNLPAWLNQTDAYRAFLSDQNYTWGSNTFKCRQGSMFTTMNIYGFDTLNRIHYEQAASGILHYMHGVNPLTKAYITNMGPLGAENSVTEIYHAWFYEGSPLWDAVGTSTYGPAPGFIPGGPNPGYDWDPCCPNNCGSSQNNALCNAINLSPPKNQPIQKSYADFNQGWPVNSWSVTEPGIYTHAAYLRLVSQFVTEPCSTGNIAVPEEKTAALYLYPNPATEKLFVKFTDFKGGNIMIYHIEGKLIQNISPENISQEFLEIDVSTFTPGVYIFQYRHNDVVWARKFIVQ